MTTWRLKHGADRRIRSGHPWVFSNELAESPKGHEPGAPVILQDSKGSFVAAGYGNPNSLISFRATTFDSLVKQPTSIEFLQQKVMKAWRQRHSLGYTASFRLCYGEGDYLPGLVIDRYLVEQNGKTAQVFAAQILTAGLSRALTAAVPDLELFFKGLVAQAIEDQISQIPWEQTAVVIRNDVNVRKLEGLDYQAAKLFKAVEAVDLKAVNILLHSPLNFADLIPMTVDLIDGQKTGFFLDQAYNIQVLCLNILRRKWQGPVKVLDLCCYVGQWSTMIAHTLKSLGVACETTLVDVSAEALKFAKINSERQGAAAKTLMLDVVQDLGGLQDRAYDIVIADPPAFVKAKKDLPTGKHAYLKLNTQAFRVTKSGGLVASCSCSGLFEESELIDVVRKSIQRDTREARCIGHGGHAPDHPVLMAFGEGFYLKMFLHSIGT
jgi:23S rRNA (cytosine1962-C5)-methyltransferase